MGNYVRSITATVDDSVQTADVVVRAYYRVDNSGDTDDCETTGDTCWNVPPDSANLADSTAESNYDWQVPPVVTRATFHVDFTDQFDRLHHFDFDNVTLRRVPGARMSITPGKAGYASAIYSIDWNAWSKQTPTIPGEQMLWLNRIPIRSNLVETLPGQYRGNFIQYGVARGVFIYK